MLIRKPADIPPSEITKESAYLSRRAFARTLAAGVALAATPQIHANLPQDELTPEDIVTSYNNFYEFGLDKDDPAAYAHEMTTDPWKVEVVGEANNKGTFDLQDILKGLDVEERIYRFRCVEAWSMVVPWMGVPLKKVLENKELQDLVTALGCGIGKHVDLGRLRYERIILLADADSDGHHITTLLLTYSEFCQVLSAAQLSRSVYR